MGKTQESWTVMKRNRIGTYLFVVAAFISFLFSVSLWFGGQREEGLFVGLWVPSILALGCLLLSGKHFRGPVQ